MLTACAGSTISTNRPIFTGILSDTDARPCPAPAKLPTGPLQQGGIETYWKRDRLALVRCAAEKRELYKKVRSTLEKAAKK
jgi:hypothetical protein